MAMDWCQANHYNDLKRYRSNCPLGCQIAITPKIRNYHLQAILLPAVARYFLIQVSINKENFGERMCNLHSQKDLQRYS